LQRRAIKICGRLNTCSLCHCCRCRMCDDLTLWEACKLLRWLRTVKDPLFISSYSYGGCANTAATYRAAIMRSKIKRGRAWWWGSRPRWVEELVISLAAMWSGEALCSHSGWHRGILCNLRQDVVSPGISLSCY